MKKGILLILVSFLLVNYGFTSHSHSKNTSDVTTAEEIPIYNFEELEPLLHTESDKIHIVNFWAMWCAPCVKEIPVLQEFEKNNPDVEVLMVSLDFPENIETKLKPFLKKKGISSKVVLLDDPDANSWIDKIDPNWSGAIPFTIIFNNEKRSYHERAFENLEDLQTEVNKTIQN